MRRKGLRIIGALVGDIYHQPGAKTKYGQLFELIEQRLDLIAVFDGTLRGSDKWLNALQTIHPNRKVWREKFWKNIPAFSTRTKRVKTYLNSRLDQFDAVFQVGVLFDAYPGPARLSHVIYTDYTMALTARKPDSGRASLSRQDTNKWIALERKAYQRASHICTRGKFVRDSIINDYGILPEQITAIGGGVNFESVPKNTIKMSQQPTILFIGKDFYRKGGDILLKAFAQVRAEFGEACLLLLTADRIPAGLPLEGVEIITPTWDRKQIAQLYRRANMFVLPSRLETWGDVLLEAMAFGLPCIGVESDAMEEIIDHGQTGYIIPSNDPVVLAKAIKELLNNKALLQQMGVAARNKVESQYTWASVVDRLIPIIEAASADTKERLLK